MELKRLKRDVLYRGRIIDLVVDEIEYPGGTRGVREIARHPGGAAVVPLLDDMRVMLVEQLRYPLGKRIAEIPAGKLAPGEDPAVAAARELEEETGWTAGSLEKLASIYTTPGFCDEELHIYLARGLRQLPGGHRREEGEFTMEVQLIPFGELIAGVEKGKVKDGKTIVGLLLTERRLGQTR